MLSLDACDCGVVSIVCLFLLRMEVIIALLDEREASVEHLGLVLINRFLIFILVVFVLQVLDLFAGDLVDNVLDEFGVSKHSLTVSCLLVHHNCVVQSPPLSLITCFVLEHSQVDLLDLADLPEELLDELLFDWTQKVAQVHTSLVRDINKAVLCFLTQIDFISTESFVIVKHCLLAVYGDFEDVVSH